MNWHQKRKEAIEAAIIRSRGSLTDRCVVCGEKFRVKAVNHKYCSKKCKAVATKKVAQGKRFTVLHRDNFRCIYCGRAPWNTEDIILHLDHIRPHALGGKNVLSNLVTSCSHCNEAKSAMRLLNESEIKKVVKERNTTQGLNPKQVIKLYRR